jgi:hypothetical protein
MPNLRSLSLRRMQTVNVFQTLELLPKLESLAIAMSYYTRVFIQDKENANRTISHSLKQLKFRNCKITDLLLFNVESNLPNLKELTFRACKLPNSIVWDNCRSIRTIRFQCCEWIDSTLPRLILGKRPTRVTVFSRCASSFLGHVGTRFVQVLCCPCKENASQTNTPFSDSELNVESNYDSENSDSSEEDVWGLFD